MRIREAAMLFTLLLAACGGTTLLDTFDGGGADDGAPNTPCGRYAQAYCDKRESCTNGSLITRDFGDMTTCVTRETLACTDALAAPRTGQTEALVEQCTTAMPSYACADFMDNNLPETCNPLGPAAEGEPCTFNAQCSSGYCADDRYSTCGTCAEPPSALSSCAFSNCGHDQACIWNAVVNNVCEPYVPTGSACGAYSNPICEADLTCAGASSATGIGGTCEPALETLGMTCGSQNMGLGCDTTRGLWCTAPPDQGASCGSIVYVGDGMPCGYVSGGVAECTSGTCYSSGGPYFTYTGTTTTGTCKAFAADGAACDTMAGPECLSPARCVTSGGSTSGTCTVPVASVSAACK
jgi:hypothetical protein